MAFESYKKYDLMNCYVAIFVIQESTVQLMPAFSDILAAIVSLIIDVTILESQFITSKDECVEKGKRLVQTGLILLGKL